MRWLTVRVPGDPVREILLERPGPPVDGRRHRRAGPRAPHQGRGRAARCSSPPRTPHGTYETLKERGVEVTDEPSTRPYGIDFGIRDPFGNAIRIGQMFDGS